MTVTGTTIVGAAFCPQPPLLVPQVASGAAAETAELRAACIDAVRAVCRDARPVLLGSGPTASYPPGTRGSLAGFGVPLEVRLGSGPEGGDAPAGPAALPPSLAVGAWLVTAALGDVPMWAIAADGTADMTLPTPPDDAVALVVMGDGSARGSTSAPGHLDERAAAFDGAVAAALAGGDPAALAALDAGVGRDLLAAGVPAWHAAAALLTGRRYAADVIYADAPYGVAYFVATWTARG